MQTREQLQENIKTAKAAVYAAEEALEDFDAAPAQNMFELEERMNGDRNWLFRWATDCTRRALTRRAEKACDGSAKRPPKQYLRGFLVEGVEYLGILHVEYNRNADIYTVDDKDTTFSYIKVDK